MSGQRKGVRQIIDLKYYPLYFRKGVAEGLG
jgi:hypothetical protein